jgi:hypothetical protein
LQGPFQRQHDAMITGPALVNIVATCRCLNSHSSSHQKLTHVLIRQIRSFVSSHIYTTNTILEDKAFYFQRRQTFLLNRLFN